MLAVLYSGTFGEGDVAYSGGRLVDSGFDVETSILLSLLSDAPALPGDVLPPGVTRRGWWADIFDADGDTFGSRLWLLEHAEATEATASRARTYAEESTAWLVRDGHLRALDFWTSLDDLGGVYLEITATLPDGQTRRVGPLKVN